MSSILSSQSLPTVAPGHWVLDPTKSTTTFTVRNFGFKKVHGTIPIQDAAANVDIEGTLTEVHAVLRIAELKTDNPRRDKDLAKPHLLDTRSYPTMAFDGHASGAVITGVLSVRGVEVPIELECSVTVDGPNSLTIDATTGFDREPLKMKAPRLMIGGWIDVNVSAVFRRDAP